MPPPAVLLGIAIAIEVLGTLALRASDGFSRPVPTAITFVAYGTAFWLLALIVRAIPISTTYAIWSGVGTAAIAAIGMIILGEPAGALKVLSIALIVVGVVGLNLSGAAHQ
jgi:small multidrug resistance pump